MSIILAFFSFLLQMKKNHQIAELNQQANAANGSAFAYMQMISDYHFGKEIRLYGLGKYLCSTFEKLWSSSIGYMLLKKLGREKALIPCISAFCNGLLDMQNKQVTLKTALYKKFDGDGVEISGGEAQKIAIARALYRNGICMILDEPTAALDPRTEVEVYESFHCMTSDKMVIYISHRLSSCRFCQQILVLDQGRVIQEGNHGMLVNQEGMYRTLWQAQAQFYES